MVAFTLRRVVLAVVVVWGVVSITFVVTQLAGDPVVLLTSTLSQQDAQALRHSLGLDKPLVEQYVNYIGHAIQGDFGTSFRQRAPALGLVLERLPATLALAFSGVLLSVLIAIPLGALSAVRRGTKTEGIVMVGALMGQAMPGFWLGLLLILFFGVTLRWFPVGGGGDLAHLVLPAVAVAAAPLARNTRLLRSSMLEELGNEYVVTAHAKGLKPLTVLTRHVLRSSLIATVTFVALDFATLLGGAIIVETVFGWPGAGRLTVQAIQQWDAPVIVAGVAVLGVIVVAFNLVADLSYGFLDPRIRYS